MNTLILASALASQLANGDFEKQMDNWNAWGGVPVQENCKQGKTCVSVHNSVATWSGIDQSVQLAPGTDRIRVTGWMRSDDVVPGAQSWEKARVAVEFRNRAGDLVGGYPPAAQEMMGSHDWTSFERVYTVPDGAEAVLVQAALGNATGTAYFDGLELRLLDKNGKELAAGKRSGPTDYGKWYTLDAATSGSHFVDWSALLDAPAGKHGFVQVKEGAFAFADGTPIRFFGGNLSGEQVFVDKPAADSLAAKLARMGVNCLRLHHMDAPWAVPNLFSQKGGAGRELDAKSLDQLDYLVHALKQKGIYVFLDLLVHRDFPRESIPAATPDLGGKQVGIFARELIDLQKDYATRLLTHVNAYTGLAYKDEPAIMASEFINESTIFSTFGGNIVEGYWWNRLDSLWQQQGGKPGTLASFDMDWSGPRPKLKAGRHGNDEEASLRFMKKLEAEYYNEMKKHLRGLGVRYPLTGSTLPLAVLPYQANNAELTDFIASNEYWDHPQVWKIGNDWNRILWAPFDNQSQLLAPSRSMVQSLARFKVAGKPYIATEWNHNYPNEYVLEGAIMAAAYGDLQGFDGMLQFDFNHRVLGKDRIENFKVGTIPGHMAQWVVAAPLFLRGDVGKASGEVVEGIADKQIFHVPAYSDFLDKNWALTYITRVSKSFNGSSSGSPEGFLDRFYDPSAQTVRSQNNALKLDYGRGFLTVNTARTQGALGFYTPDTVDLPTLRIAGLRNPHASVMLTSADTLPLESSTRLYLVAVGPARMQGQKYNANRNQLTDIGKGKVEMQVVEGTLILKSLSADRLTATERLANGKPGRTLQWKTIEGGSALDLSTLRSPVVEITVRR